MAAAVAPESAPDVRPDSALDVLGAVRGALADATPLEIAGGGTKRGWGRPVEAAARLDLSDLRGITLYEPEELVLSARPGTPLAEIEAALAERGQAFAFEPPDFGPLFGQDAGRQTLGGVVAANLSGSRRVAAGAVRDHLLGFRGVTGRGEAIKAGGRVVKNVTGYDLCKAMCGSFGTLAVFTELTVKVLPAPEKTRTVLLYGLGEADAVRAMGDGLASPHEVSAAAHLPVPVAARSAVRRVGGAGTAVTALRVEGPGPSVEHRCAALRTLFAARVQTEELHGWNSATFWKAAGDVAPLLPDGGRILWRLSVPPAAGAAVAAAIRETVDAEHFLDWGGGLLWLAIAPGAADGGAGSIRRAVDASGGHATLIRAPDALRAAVPVFHPQPEAVAALSGELRAQFDPQGILNPRRMG